MKRIKQKGIRYNLINKTFIVSQYIKNKILMTENNLYN